MIILLSFAMKCNATSAHGSAISILSCKNTLNFFLLLFSTYSALDAAKVENPAIKY